MSKSPKSPKSPAEAANKPKRRRSWLRKLGMTLLILIALLCIARMATPWGIRWYVNRTLEQSQIYQGKIGEIEVNLWRGAYAIRDVRLVKMTGNVPVPFFAAERVEFALQWDALLHRKMVGRVRMERPDTSQYGKDSVKRDTTGAR